MPQIFPNPETNELGGGLIRKIQSITEFEQLIVPRSSGATVHDMFNWLTVIVLLPLEVVTGYLARLSGLMVQNIPDSSTGSGQGVKIPGLDLITDPFTDLIIQVYNYPAAPAIQPLSSD